MASPQISVVMGVYNGATVLRKTVLSVLTQEGVDLEFVIVDDGSTDSTPALLEDLTKADRRVRVFRQPNRGLTRALIHGCKEARGNFVARQDCGDLSLPGRLLMQLQATQTHPDAALVSCGTRFVGPAEETLYEITMDALDASTGLAALELELFRGPACHPCTMFRRDLYESVGGYRKEFHFAQDLDLWTRLSAHGPHIPIPAILYQAAFSPGGISGQQRKRQVECAKILFECARLRRAGLSEADALAKAQLILPDPGGTTRAKLAAAFYFVGMCLRKRGDSRAREYFREALRANPLHFKSALRLFWR